MLYYKDELTYEECMSLKKQGYHISLYKCENKTKCNQYQNRTARNKCPGKLIENGKPYECGWNTKDTVKGSNTIMIAVNDPDRFIPQHIIPII